MFFTGYQLHETLRILLPEISKQWSRAKRWNAKARVEKANKVDWINREHTQNDV